jgi:NUMOD3 motif-containing protein
MSVIALKIQRTPYTYILEWTAQNKRYIGARWAKGCHPDDLWQEYFTSSAYVKEFIALHGAPDVILIDKIFSSPEEAMAREMELLRKYDAAKSHDFLNKNIQGIYDINDPDIRRRNIQHQIGVPKSPEVRRKISETKKGKKLSPAHRAAISRGNMGKQGGMLGKKHTPEWVAWFTEYQRTRIRSPESAKRISAANKGKKRTPEQVEKCRLNRLGKPHSEETRAKMRAASKHLKNKIVTCPHCGKVGGEGGMIRWHFDNCPKKGG